MKKGKYDFITFGVLTQPTGESHTITKVTKEDENKVVKLEITEAQRKVILWHLMNCNKSLDTWQQMEAKKEAIKAINP